MNEKYFWETFVNEQKQKTTKIFAKCKLSERIEHNGARTLNKWQRNKET